MPSSSKIKHIAQRVYHKHEIFRLLYSNRTFSTCNTIYDVFRLISIIIVTIVVHQHKHAYELHTSYSFSKKVKLLKTTNYR